VNRWLKQIKQEAPEEVKIILVGNKSDLENNRVISYEKGADLARMHQIDFFETSAFNGENIHGLFHRIGELIIEDLDKNEDSGDEIGGGGKKPGKGCCK
jgi:GTPase SAR1 family protein